jgi:hypothetical protein
MLSVVDKLVGIYNANGSLIGELQYFFGKLTGQTHCALCDITHGMLREKTVFSNSKQALGIPFENLHLDELNPELQIFKDFAPCVVAFSEAQFSLLITKAELELCDGDVNCLFTLIKSRVL